MLSLDLAFDSLVARLRQGDTLNPAKSDPVFYFVYPPSRMLDVNQSLSRWAAKVKVVGLDVERVSVLDLVWRIVDESGRWEAWLALEEGADLAELSEVVRDVLRSKNKLADAVAEHVIKENPGKIVFLTETESLHPYFRTRTIESWLHDRVKVPMIIFYPGRRSGQYGLRFLDLYPEDGNYRSTIVGAD